MKKIIKAKNVIWGPPIIVGMFVLLMLLSPPAFASPASYIDTIAPYAAVVADYGYPPSVAIAQSCRETGFGQHLDDLDIDGNQVRQYNNVLGKKWHYGEYFVKLTPEGWGPTREYVPRKFQVYDSLAECFEDYAENITNNPAYANKDTSSVEAFIWSIAPKYATDNTEAYANGVLRIIRDYDLTRYDRRE